MLFLVGLFHLIVLLNPVFNCSNNLISFSVAKVTTGTYNFVSFILNVAPVVLLILAPAGLSPYAGTTSFVDLLVTTQFLNQVEAKYTSQ